MFKKIWVASTCLSLCLATLASGGLKSPSEDRSEYTSFTSLKGYQNNDIALEPANIFTINNKEALINLPETNYPQIVELTIDQNIDVVDSNNIRIDSLENVFVDYLQNRILPAVRLTDDRIATSYINYVETKCYIPDSYIITDDLSVLRQLSSNSSTDDMNLVFDVTNFDLDDEETLDNILFEGNRAKSTIYVLNGMEKNLVAHVNFFQKRFKTTWIQTDSSITNIARAIASGGYGLISTDYKAAEDMLSKFTLEGRNRPQYVAAHRGITAGYNENSLPAVMEASDINADYVEIDLQITKDNKVIICHDSQPYYTSDCENSSKRFINMTYDEISQFTLNDQDINAGQHYPLLSQLFDATKDTDLVYILEFKFDEGSADALLRDVAQYVDPIVREYHYQNRVLGITFFKGFYSSIAKHMPYMPTANLGLSGDSEYKTLRQVPDLIHFFKKYNTGMDYAYNLDMVDKRYDYGFRGYSSNGYTFNDKKHLYRPMQICTSNVVETLADDVKQYAGSTWINVASASEINDTMNLEWMNYDGKIVTLPSKIIILNGNKDSDPYLTCVANYYSDIDEYGLYSPIFTISNASLGGDSINNIQYAQPQDTLLIGDDGEIITGDNSNDTSAEETSSSESTSQTTSSDSDNNNVNYGLWITVISICVVALATVAVVIVRKSKKQLEVQLFQLLVSDVFKY